MPLTDERADIDFQILREDESKKKKHADEKDEGRARKEDGSVLRRPPQFADPVRKE